MSVTRINEFHAAPGQEDVLRAFLRGVVAAIASAPGCDACELLVSHDDHARLAIIERWTTVAAHQAAASRIPPEQMAAFRPLIASPPVGRYYDPA